jgi:hypothetical protein
VPGGQLVDRRGVRPEHPPPPLGVGLQVGVPTFQQLPQPLPLRDRTRMAACK